MASKIRASNFWSKLTRVGLIAFVVLFFFGVGFGSGVLTLALVRNNEAKPYTSDQLLDAVNQYRTSKGLKPLVLAAPLCNDLVSRWDNYVKNENHEGLQEWVKRTGVQQKGFTDGHENIVSAQSVDKAMEWWLGSQGHRLAIEDPDSDSACVYVKNYIAVLMMANDTSR